MLVPNFVKFNLFFIFAYSENFMCLSCMVKKLEIWLSRLRGTPILICPNVVKSDIFVIIANSKTFKCPACVARKFDVWRPHLRGTPHFGGISCFKFYVSFKFTYLKHFMYLA